MQRIPSFILAAVVLLCALPAAASAPVPRAADLYLKRGRMVDIGGFRLNMYCVGSGSPTVVFDSGLEDWAPAWITIQPVISQTTRTCTYDRAGNGLSDPGPLPRTSARIVSELHTLLRNAGEHGPFILVGHSFGGINVRQYADRYLPDVAGLVLDDASAESQLLYMTPKEQRENDKEIAQAQRFMSKCHAFAVRHFHGAPVKYVHACPGTFFRGLPDPKDFPGRLDATLIAEAEQPKQYIASGSEFTNFTTAGFRTLLKEHRYYGSIPVRILVAYHHGESQKDEKLWQMLHRQWLSLSSDSKYIPATKSGHYIQFDQPGLVINAIRDEIRIVRNHNK